MIVSAFLIAMVVATLLVLVCTQYNANDNSPHDEEHDPITGKPTTGIERFLLQRGEGFFCPICLRVNTWLGRDVNHPDKGMRVVPYLIVIGALVALSVLHAVFGLAFFVAVALAALGAWLVYSGRSVNSASASGEERLSGLVPTFLGIMVLIVDAAASALLWVL